VLTGLGLTPQNLLYHHADRGGVSIANIWRGTAFSMLVYSAALSEVPKDVVGGGGRGRRRHLAHALLGHVADVAPLRSPRT